MTAIRGRGGTAAVAVLLALVSGALLVPAVAGAHGLVGKTDLPIPRWLFAWAAAVVLIVSFVGLATLWPKPRLEQARERLLITLPRALEVIPAAIGMVMFSGLIYAGIAGTSSATANVVPTFVYVIFWVGLAFASLLLGDVFSAFNPWRAFARLVAWLARRAWRRPLPEPMAYPQRLGRWPAVVGIVAFAWLELVYVAPQKDDPERLAVFALAYAAVQFVGMSLYGIESWSRWGDAFGVYFGLFGRLSPLRWDDGRLRLRAPAVGAAHLDMVPGTVALLAVMIGSTSFDGFSVGSVWVSAQPHVQSFFADLGAAPTPAGELAGTVGLAAMILAIGGLYRLGILGVRSVGGERDAGELARRFGHSLLPIALAYVIAHYFSLLVFQGQAMGYLISDPLGQGSNVFGTANSQIDYNAIASNTIWYVQVGALILGHVAGLILAHDRALTMYRKPSQAARSQYWMLAVMVAFTSLGLWILSSTQ